MTHRLTARKKLAKYLTAAAMLPAPVATQSAETIERHVIAIGRINSGLLLGTQHERFIFTTPFNPDQTTREGVFGKMVDSKRTTISDKETFDWRAFFPLSGKHENRVLALDGTRLAFIELDAKNFSEIARRGMPADHIKPPRDRSGEPTTAETKEFRAEFSNAMRKLSGTIVTGAARIPDDWMRNGRTNYLMHSRLPRFPLLLATCSRNEPSQCIVERGCNLEGYKGTPTEQLAGIAIKAEKREVVLGDPIARKLHVLKFDSCFHVPYRSSIGLPDSLKKLTNIFVDEDGRLFVSTDQPDDYLNASLFYWRKDQWK